MTEERWNGKSESFEKLNKAYFTKEVATTLGVSDSYLRKWCLELERNGYTFVKVRDGKNKENRAFSEHDVIALRKFQELIGNAGTSRSDAAKIIVQDYKVRDRNGGTGDVPAPLFQSNDRDKALLELKELYFNELKDQLKEQVKEELKAELEQGMKKAITSAEERFEERLNSHDRLLMQTIREMQETKLQIASAKKTRWWKFWKK
ncbi:DUF3967 domain-containing protein [Ectobacillus funiculus]|jgi:hypothetical protein|uniref:DUF3967 domain-containing protein n=1 Tax=Ectobacillus funiculus TaxID=137993 RepID=A0ABV5W9Y5_9BACI